MIADARFRFWCASLDVAEATGIGGRRAYLWLVGKAADADYDRWGYDSDPDLSEVSDDAEPF